MQLLGPDVDITQKDIVGDDVLDKGCLVVLLLVVGLGPVEGHGRHGADQPGVVVLAADKHSIVKLGTPAGQRLEGLALKGDNLVSCGVHSLHRTGPTLSNIGQLIAGHHRSLGIDDANGSV